MWTGDPAGKPQIEARCTTGAAGECRGVVSGIEDLRAADETLREIESGEGVPVPWERVKDKIGPEHEDPERP